MLRCQNLLKKGIGIVVGCVPLLLHGSTEVVANGEVYAPPIGVTPLTQYTQQSGGIYLAQFNNSGASSYIQVSGNPGTATLDSGSILQLQLNQGNFQLATPYTILSTNPSPLVTPGVIGTFSTVTSNLNSALVPLLNYQPETVFISLVTDFASLANTGNQRQIARVLDNNPHATGDLFYVINNLLEVSDEQVPYDLDQLSGQQYTSLFQISRLSTQRFLRSLFDPILFKSTTDVRDCCEGADPCCSPLEPEVWAEVHYGRSFLDGNHNVRGYKSYHLDALLGYQQQLNECYTIGLAAFYENEAVDYNLNGDASVNSIQGALYGIYEGSCLYSLADITFGYHHFNVKRQVKINQVNRSPTGRPNVFDIGLYNEWGYTYCITPCLNFQPFLGVEGAYFWYNNFSEKGGCSINLEVKNKKLWVCDSRLGLRINAFLPCNVVFSTAIAWDHAYGKDSTRIKAHFEGVGEDFHIHGSKQKSNALEGSVYIGAQALDMTVFVEADAIATGNATDYSVKLGIDIPI